MWKLIGQMLPYQDICSCANKNDGDAKRPMPAGSAIHHNRNHPQAVPRKPAKTTTTTPATVKGVRRLRQADQDGKSVVASLPRSMAPTAHQPVIVVFRPSALRSGVTSHHVCASLQQETSVAEAVQIKRVFAHGLKGFSAQIPQNKMSYFLSHPAVHRIEPDRVIYALPVSRFRRQGTIRPMRNKLQQVETKAAISNTKNVRAQDAMAVAATQVPWNINSIGAKNSGNVNIPTLSVPIDVFVLDTGVDIGHPALNVVEARTYVPSEANAMDLNGHGTHVAGIIGALDNDNPQVVVGVAPGARIHAYKVLDQNGEGQSSWAIAALDDLIQLKMQNASVPMVANMSLGFDTGSSSYNAMDEAVAAAVSAGIPISIAAGNDSMDTALVSPAHVTTAMAVGSYDQQRQFSSFSNTGNLVVLNAPGENIKSTWLNNGYETLSGTSMASPHVCGVSALHLWRFPTQTPLQVRQALVANGQPFVGSAPSFTTNLSIYAPYFGPQPATLGSDSNVKNNNKTLAAAVAALAASSGSQSTNVDCSLSASQ